MAVNKNFYKILLLDDDDKLRFNLKLFLEDEEFDCTAVEDAEQALEVLQTQSFDIAIVDIRLPGIPGDEFIPKANRIDPKLRYIIHTGSTDFKLSDQLMDIGVTQDFVYIKPVPNMGVFLEAFRRLIPHTP